MPCDDIFTPVSTRILQFSRHLMKRFLQLCKAMISAHGSCKWHEESRCSNSQLSPTPAQTPNEMLSDQTSHLYAGKSSRCFETDENTEGQLGLSKPRRSPSRPGSVTQVWRLALLVFLATAGVRAETSALSPGSLLKPASGGKTWRPAGAGEKSRGVGESGASPVPTQMSVPESQVMKHFSQNGRKGEDYPKASTTFMVRLFNSLTSGSSLTQAVGARRAKRTIGRSDTIRSFSPSGKVKLTKKGKHVRVKFRIPHLPPKERLRAAEVRLLRPASAGHMASKRAKLRLSIRAAGQRGRSRATTRERPVEEGLYTVFSLGNVLTPWINERHGNVTVTLRVPRRYVLPLETAGDVSGAEEVPANDVFLIVLYLSDKEFLSSMYRSYTQGDRSTELMQADQGVVRSRQKRYHRDNIRRWRKRGGRKMCQLVDFQVDFKVIGWARWIIHPKAFNARFCYGECPARIDSRYKPTNHAMLQTLMRTKRRHAAPSPCCVPIKLRPLSMLYVEYGEIVVRHHDDMVAEECGCR